jgi:hypothetical protein
VSARGDAVSGVMRNSRKRCLDEVQEQYALIERVNYQNREVYFRIYFQ